MTQQRPTRYAGFYLRPLSPDTATAGLSSAVPLAGGPLGFALCEVVLRDGPSAVERETLPLADLAETLRAEDPAKGAAAEAWLSALSRPRPDFAGLDMTRTQIMGVINVTPDSFSDGGDRFDAGRAVADGLAMVAAGAAILDVGGESTRPGADPVGEAEELRRVVPVVRGLAEQGAKVSIDTRNPGVMAEALAAGAAVVNDVTALTGHPDSLALVAEAKVPVILMHMQGDPRTMQASPRYDDAALDVFDYLAGRLAACEEAGIDPARVALDPGIGFGKSLDHNLEILAQLSLFHGLGCPLLLGVSRKSFIARLAGEAAPKDRVAGSLAAALAGVRQGVQILRVHDVAETAQAVAIWQGVERAGRRPAKDGPGPKA